MATFLSRPPFPSRIALALAVCLFVHVALSLVYSFTMPIWESYDETGHYAYARYIAINHRLPPLGAKLAPYDESHQPPLYYVLIALAISGLDTSDNLQPRLTALGSKIVVVPDECIDSFPFHGTALAIRVGRLVSILLGTLSVAITFLIVRSAAPGRTDMALMATAIHALWPLFLALNGAITNDVGITLFGSLTLLTIVRLWVQPPDRSRRAGYLALAGCLAGATLTKDTGIALWIFSAFAVSALIVRDLRACRSPRRGSLGMLMVLLIVLTLLGAAISDGRSLRQFGTASAALSASPQLITQPVTTPEAAAPPNRLATFVQNLLTYVIPTTFKTTFGSFGWGAFAMPEEWYMAAAIGGCLSLIGLVIALRTSRTRGFALMLVLFLFCVMLAPLARAILSSKFDLFVGRFFMPALSALSILIALGLLALPHRIRRGSAILVLATIEFAAIMAPVVVIAPIYRRPVLLDSTTISLDSQAQKSIVYGEAIQLLGYSLPAESATRGKSGSVTLFWRSLKPMADDYILRIEPFIQSTGASIFVRQDYTPGRGTFPTSAWKTGDTFSETYELPIPMHVDAPTVITFKVSWVDPLTNQPLSAKCDNRVTCEPLFGRLPIRLDAEVAQQWLNRPALYSLGNQLELIDFHAPVDILHTEPITTTLVWRAKANNLPAYTVFVHLIAPNGEMIAQSDSPPRNSQYPTEFWSSGDIVPDTLSVTPGARAQPGVYKLVVGVYDARTIERLPAFDAQGKSLRDSLITLQEITVR